ncbi:MAG: penicillin-binding protein activator [Desulfobacterales bacterium]
MKRLFFVLALSGLFACTACAPKGVVPGVFEKEKPGAELLRKAESSFKEERLDAAFSFYQDYISRYPDGEMVPEALIQMGIIKGRQENYAQAVSHFKDVMKSYPESEYAGEAGAEKLSVLYDAGDFEAVIRQAAAVFSYELSREAYVRAGLSVGDAYMALDLPREAYFAFLKAFDRAKEKKAEKKVLPRLKTAVSRLPVDLLKAELARLDGRPPSGCLTYHVGRNYAAQGNLGDAMVTWADFLDRYPDHELAEAAKERLEEIKTSGAADQVNVGCLLPLTGRYGEYGNQALHGLEMALSISGQNASNRPIHLIVADTASDPEQARKAVDELNEKRVTAIIGPIATSEAAAKAAQEHGIPIITLTQSSGIPEIGEFVFRNFITPQMQVRTLARYAAETLGIDRFAVLYPDENYGETFMNLFWDELLERKASVVGLEDYNPAHTDFSVSIKKLAGLYYDVPADIEAKTRIGPLEHQPSPFEDLWGIGGDDSGPDAETRSEADLAPYIRGLFGDGISDPEEEPQPIVDFKAVFLPDSPEKAGLIIPQLAYYDINDVYLLGTNLWHSDKFIEMAPRYVQGAICPSGFYAESRSDAVRRFVDEFRRVYGEEPDFFEAIGFDTAMMLIDLLDHSPYFGRTYIREQLPAMPPYDGITGKTRFDDTGEVIKELYLLKVSGRRFVEVSF